MCIFGKLVHDCLSFSENLISLIKFLLFCSFWQWNDKKCKYIFIREIIKEVELRNIIPDILKQSNIITANILINMSFS
jgi:hypothetical protein